MIKIEGAKTKIPPKTNILKPCTLQEYIEFVNHLYNMLPCYFVLNHLIGFRNLNPYNFCMPNYVKTFLGGLKFPLSCEL